MKFVSIDKNLKGENLNTFLEFLGKHGTKMSITRYYRGKLTKDDFDQVQKEYSEYIYQEHTRRYSAYKDNKEGYKVRIDNMIGSSDKAESYFQAVLEQELNMLNDLTYENVVSENFNDTKFESEDLIEIKYTRRTPVTRGPLFEVCYFNMGGVFRQLSNEMTSLYQFPYYIHGQEFENMTIYNDERILLAICSHEQFDFMNVTDEEYEELMTLNILEILGDK
jgi:hypothetical protein